MSYQGKKDNKNRTVLDFSKDLKRQENGSKIKNMPNVNKQICSFKLKLKLLV